MKHILLIIYFIIPLLTKAQEYETVKIPLGTECNSTGLGIKIFCVPELSAIRYLKITADNDIELRTAAEMLIDLGAQGAITTGTNSQYFRGDLSLATFPTTTAAFSNSTNKNFVTDAQLTNIGNLSGTNTGDQTSVSGNAGTATALQNARTINGVSFDGTSNITVTAAAGTLSGTTLAAAVVTSSLTTVGTIGTGTWQGSVISSTYGGTGVNNGGRTLTLNTNSGTLAFSAASKTLTVANTLTLSGTDASTLNIGGGGTLGSNAFTSTAYQPLATNLTSIGALANGNGFLKNNGSGVFTYENPAGSGTVTNTGTLTSNSVVLGNGSADVTTVAGITTNGTSQLVLGVNTTSLGSVKMFGNTSGDATIQPAAVAGTATVITLPNVTGTLLLNTTTSGVAATPTASGTVTITHNLGRIPTTIRIYSISSFTSNAAATPVPFSMGVWNSSGNRCVYMVINGTTTQVSQTSTTFAIIMVTSAGNRIEGVIQNVTSTGFDIAFTETGTHTAGNYLWEAQ